MKDVKKSDSNPGPMISSPTLLPLGYRAAAAESTENLWYLCTTFLTQGLLMYTVARPDPNTRGGVNYLTLTSAILP